MRNDTTFSDFHPQEISGELVAYLHSFLISERGAFQRQGAGAA